MKYILLAVAGLSPRVITETLFALHESGRKIDEIHVITTRDGKENIFSHLLGGPGGHFYRYLEDYGLEKRSVRFDHDDVHVIKDPYGNELVDILTAEDNERLLALCLELTFELTSDKDTSIFFSVAGGRKTMSSCLTLAAQLYGRPCDRIYHVLVSPEFESSRDFFYPSKPSRRIELKDRQGTPYYKDTKFARITLVPVPFVSVRDRLSSAQLKDPKDPGTLMLSLIKDQIPCLTINVPDRKISYKTLEMDVTPSQAALYAFFTMVKKDCPKESNACINCHDCFLEISDIEKKSQDISKLYRATGSTRPMEEMSSTGIAGLTRENFRSLRSKINKAILDTFGPDAARQIEISATGTRPDTSYGIRMDKTKIKMVI